MLQSNERTITLLTTLVLIKENDMEKGKITFTEIFKKSPQYLSIKEDLKDVEYNKEYEYKNGLKDALSAFEQFLRRLDD